MGNLLKKGSGIFENLGETAKERRRRGRTRSELVTGKPKASQLPPLVLSVRAERRLMRPRTTARLHQNELVGKVKVGEAAMTTSQKPLLGLHRSEQEFKSLTSTSRLSILVLCQSVEREAGIPIMMNSLPLLESTLHVKLERLFRRQPSKVLLLVLPDRSGPESRTLMTTRLKMMHRRGSGGLIPPILRTMNSLFQEESAHPGELGKAAYSRAQTQTSRPPLSKTREKGKPKPAAKSQAVK